MSIATSLFIVGDITSLIELVDTDETIAHAQASAVALFSRDSNPSKSYELMNLTNLHAQPLN